MSANVFLVPIDPENFDRTVQSAVDLTEYDDRPDPLADLDEVRLWAVDDDSGNGSTFERMEEGDLLLFYHDGEYLATGRVGTAFEDEDRWVSSTRSGPRSRRPACTQSPTSRPLPPRSARSTPSSTTPRRTLPGSCASPTVG